MYVTTIIIASLFFIFFLGTLYRPIIGILAYISVYLIYNSTLWWCEPFRGSRPSLIAFMFLSISCIIHKDKLDWHITRKELEFYLFLCVAWIVSIFFGVGMNEGSWYALMKITKMFAFIFLMIRVVCTLDCYKMMVWGFIFGALFLAYQAHDIGQYYSYTGRLENIGGIDFREANSLGLFMGFSIALLGFELLKAPLSRKIIYIMGLALMMNTLIFTRSRSAFLGLVFALPVVFIKVPKKYRKQIWVYVIFGVISFLMLADEGFLQRMGTIDDEALMNKSKITNQKKDQRLSRADFWMASIPMFIDHPLGIGVRNFERVVPWYDSRNVGRDAHNTYVLCYSEIGIFGIVLFFLIIVETFFQIKRTRKMAVGSLHNNEIIFFSLSISAALVIYLTGGMMTHSYLYHEITWILFAMPICLENSVKNAIAETSSGLARKNEIPLI